MANKTYYKKGSQYVDANGKAVMIAKGNQLTFTDYFDAGGGGELPVASASTLGGVKVGEGVNVASDGTISVTTYAPPAYSTTEHLTGRKWVDGRDIYEKTISYNSPFLNIPTNGAVLESSTGVDFAFNAHAIDPTYKASTPLKITVETGDLKGYAFDAQFTAETVTFEYVKPVEETPAETNANTRTVKKTVKKG